MLLKALFATLITNVFLIGQISVKLYFFFFFFFLVHDILVKWGFAFSSLDRKNYFTNMTLRENLSEDKLKDINEIIFKE